MRQLIKDRAESAVFDFKGNDLTTAIYCVLVGDSEVTDCIGYKSEKRMFVSV